MALEDIDWQPKEKLSICEIFVPGVLTSRTISREHWRKHPLEAAKMTAATLFIPLMIDGYALAITSIVSYSISSGVDYILS
ncbi:hypothetical protein HY448_01530 [Candidatus Pacearchaeota archaeon]|nr:hypothetical protein [Candidatus Pacearchaeota archaeon]